MDDLDHNLSLADALTEPPPQIEEEVKRDFMATLEAEKFDDVIGETVGKTDYVPLLDDDDPKAGNQEAKTKPHADSVQAERTSATGPAAVVENGDHGIEGSRKVSPGKTMDEKMSYKEFLDRNDSWTMGDREHGFESEPAFKPMDVTEPFKMHREDVLSDLLLLPQEMMNVPPFGEYFGAPKEVHAPFGAAGVPAQHPLGPSHPPANIFDPLVFLGTDAGAAILLNQSEAAPARETEPREDFWFGTQHLMEGQGAPFFVPPVPSKIPEVTEVPLPESPITGLIDVTGEPKLPEAKQSVPAASPPVGAFSPAPAVDELMGFEPSLDHKSLPSKEASADSVEAAVAKEQNATATDSIALVLGKQGESKPSPSQHKEKEGSSQPPGQEEASRPLCSPKVDDSKTFLSQHGREEEVAATRPFAQKAEESKPSLAPYVEKKESPLPSPKAEDPKAPLAQCTEKVEESKASPTWHMQEVAHLPSPTQEAEGPLLSPTQHAKKAGESKVSPSQPRGDPEEAKPPSSPSRPVEPLPGLEKLGENNPPPPSAAAAQMPQEPKQLPLTKPVEQLPEPAESKGSVPPGESKADSKEHLAEKPVFAHADVSKPKEVPEPHLEQPVGKAPLETAGVPPAQVRQAHKSGEHRRSGRAKPARGTVADAPEELLVGFPAQKSHDQGGEPFSMAEWGYVPGTSPRSRAPHRKAAGQLFESAEAPRDTLQEGWDLEASAALKKKKKKPKQKRSQLPKAAELWDDNYERLRTPLCSAEPQKPEVPFLESHESPKEVLSASKEVLGKDAAKLGSERQPSCAPSLPPVPATREPPLQMEGPHQRTLDAKAGEVIRAEAASIDRFTWLSKSQREEPLEGQLMPRVKQEEQGSPTSPPGQASPLGASPFGESKTPQNQPPPKSLGLDVSALETKLPASEVVPVVAGEAIAPEGPVPRREGSTEKPKGHEKGGESRRGRTGEGAARSAVEGAKAIEAAQGRSRAASEPLPEASPLRELSSGEAKSETLEVGSAEIPFVLETKSDPVQPLAPAGAVGSAKVPLTGMDKGAGSSTSEQPAGTIPRLGSDQPKKRGSDGKSKRAKNYPEQQRLFLSEDKANSSKAPGAEEAEAPADTSLAAKSTELGFSGTGESKTVPGSARVGEKPRKRNSDGKSRKAVERISFGPPFFLEVENSAVHLPTEVGSPDPAEAITCDSHEGADVSAASRLLEAAADAAKPQAMASSTGKAKGAPSRKGEWVDFPSSVYPFLLEMPGEQTECPAVLEAATQTKGTNRGKGPSFTIPEGFPIADYASVLPTSKPKKRTSDGRSKKPGKSSSEQPFFLETMSEMDKPSKKADAPKEAGSVDKGHVPGGAPLLAQSDSSQVQLPAPKPMSRTEGEKGEGINTATKGSCFEQLPTSDQKTLTSKSGLFAQTKEAPLTDQGQEASREQCMKDITDPLKSPFPELATEELGKLGPPGQKPQVHSIMEAKPEPVRPDAVQNEVAKTEKPPSSPREDKGKVSGHLLEDAKAAGLVPVVSLVDEASRTTEEGKHRKGWSSLECPSPLGTQAEADMLPDAEREAKAKEHASPRRSQEERGGRSDLASQQDPSAKPAKRGSDRKSKKAASAPQLPADPQAKADASKGHHPKLSEFECGMRGMEFVDENRNIKNLPPGHQMHWEENSVSLFGPSGSGVRDEAAPRSQGLGCPFLQHPDRFLGKLSKEQLFLPEILKVVSKSEQKDQHDLQDLSILEGSEATIEASLLMKAGDETREKRRKSKRAPSERLVKHDDGTGKGQVLSSMLAEDGRTNLLDKAQDSGLGSLELPVEEQPKMAAGREGSGSVGKETSIPPGESPALWNVKGEAAALQALTTALVSGPAEPVALAKSNRAEERTSECLDSLGSKAGADKTLEDVPVEEAGYSNKPKALSEHLESDDVSKPKISPPGQAAGEEEAGLLREVAERPGSQSLGSEAGGGAALIPQADRGDQVAREAKKEGRAKGAPQQIKGYMRPTKSRGLPPPPPPPPLLRVAAQEPGRRRPAQPDGPNQQRQEKAKLEEVKPDAEVARANDIAAPPSKELPPSPEKKAKPSASTAAAKPAAAKTKPVPSTATAAPAKRPASATPGQNKKATSPTAGPAAAATPKRPATGSARPSTLTPKDSKPKGTDVKSPDKRTSPSKTPSATTPRPMTRSNPATPRPSAALTSLNTSSPRSTATSPPKRPSSIKTDVKPTDAKKNPAKSPSADLSRPKSAPASTSPSPALPGAAASRPKPKPAVPKLPGMASATSELKKASTLKAAPKTSPIPKPPRPPTSVSAPDLKNVRSKIGSTDNIKYQPGGGKAKVERKAESAGAARKPELNAVPKTATTKTAVTKEGAQKQPNGKVQIVSKKANYSHVQSKCGSKDNIKHVPGGGNVPNAPKAVSGSHSQPSTGPKPSQGSTNVQILNKKIDLSKVSSKCGSKANIKHKPGGGDVKIENQKLNFKEKAQAKVGSLDNVGHMPAGGTVKTEGGEEAAPPNGAATMRPPGSTAMQENGVGPAAPLLGSGDQRETQCFDTHIPETN